MAADHFQSYLGRFWIELHAHESEMQGKWGSKLINFLGGGEIVLTFSRLLRLMFTFEAFLIEWSRSLNFIGTEWIFLEGGWGGVAILVTLSEV